MAGQPIVRIRNGHAIWQAVLAFLVTFVASAMLSDIMGRRLAGFLGLMVAALQAATASYYAALGQRQAPPPGAV